MRELLLRKFSPKAVDYKYEIRDQKPLIDKKNKIVNLGISGFLSKSEAGEALEKLDVKQLIKDRPEGMSEEDFIKVYKLAALTETATDIYAPAFFNAAKKYGQEEWLSDFMERVWIPDEHGHDTPFVGALFQMEDVYEDEFNLEIKRAKEAVFDYGQDYTPIMATSFGIIQEDLTDHYHGLIGKMAKKSKVNIPFANTIFHVKNRETLHRVYYTDFTYLQFLQNPESIGQMAEAYAKFTLPGNVNDAVKPYQEKAAEYLLQMGADIPALTSQILDHVGRTFDYDPFVAGKIAVDILARRDEKLVPFLPTTILQKGIEKAGDKIYKIIGNGIINSTRREDGKHETSKQNNLGRKMEEYIAYKVRNSNIFASQNAA